jgi:septal ring factor EnvC (AmiA/AmiB activator)
MRRSRLIRTPVMQGVLLSLIVGSLPACGVNPVMHAGTLRERDELRQKLHELEGVVANQRRQSSDLQAALAELRQSNRELQARISELEELTANQNVSAEGLTQQLRAATAQRDELLLQIAELERRLALRNAPAPRPDVGPSPGGPIEPDGAHPEPKN